MPFNCLFLLAGSDFSEALEQSRLTDAVCLNLGIMGVTPIILFGIIQVNMSTYGDTTPLVTVKLLFVVRMVTLAPLSLALL